MSVYVGIDVHRKRSQLAVIDAKGILRRTVKGALRIQPMLTAA